MNGREVCREDVPAWPMTRPQTDQVKYMINTTKRVIREGKK